MKKYILKGLIMLMLLGSAASLTACGTHHKISSSFQHQNVCYYGCPNSKRVKKLNLRKHKGI